MGTRKIAIILPTHVSAQMGGSEYQAERLVAELVRKGNCEVRFFADRIANGAVVNGYRLECIGTMLGKKLGSIANCYRLWKALEGFAPDVVYQRVGGAYTGVAALYSRRYGARMVWHVASDADISTGRSPWSRRWLLEWLEKWILEYGIRSANEVVAQTEWQRVQLQVRYGRHSWLIRNFHPVPRFSRRPCDKVRVVWVANVKPLKRPEIFFQLARDLSHRENVEFMMVGSAPLTERVRQSFEEELRASPLVRYLGPKALERVNEIMSETALLVNTSDYEGLPNTFIQAWLRGVPTLTLNSDPDGLLSSGVCGACAAGDYRKLLELTEMFLTNAALRKETGLKAREFAARHYGDRNLRSLISLILEGSC